MFEFAVSGRTLSHTSVYSLTYSPSIPYASSFLIYSDYAVVFYSNFRGFSSELLLKPFLTVGVLIPVPKGGFVY
jgi:hypothetical protein